MNAANENKPLASSGKCPICGKPTKREYQPFCSKRCADVDLNRWLSGNYAIPAVERRGDRQGRGRPEATDKFPRPNFCRRERWTCGARSDYTRPPRRARLRRASDAQVAQLVEHATENRSVGGSIPPLGTT